jgi:hypothetical protein
MESLPHIFQADTFWDQTIPLLLGFLACMAVACVVAGWQARRLKQRRLAKLNQLHHAQDGVATVVDFSLTIPIFIAVVFLMTQLALMVNASLVIHYAAYNAARAAKVHMLDMENAFWELDCCYVDSLFAPVGGALKLADLIFEPEGPWREETDRKVLTAAAFHLISLAPSSEQRYINRQPSVSFEKLGLRKYLNHLTDNDAARTDLLLHKARYAFDERYTKVDYNNTAIGLIKRLINENRTPRKQEFGEMFEEALVTWELAKVMKDPARALATITSIPVYAEVSFRFPLLVPFAAGIFNDYDPNLPADEPGIWLEARVKLS